MPSRKKYSRKAAKNAKKKRDHRSFLCPFAPLRELLIAFALTLPLGRHLLTTTSILIYF